MTEMHSEKGWICPNCGKGNAPWVPSCCKPKAVTNTNIKPNDFICPIHNIEMFWGQCNRCNTVELRNGIDQLQMSESDKKAKQPWGYE